MWDLREGGTVGRREGERGKVVAAGTQSIKTTHTDTHAEKQNIKRHASS